MKKREKVLLWGTFIAGFFVLLALFRQPEQNKKGEPLKKEQAVVQAVTFIPEKNNKPEMKESKDSARDRLTNLGFTGYAKFRPTVKQ